MSELTGSVPETQLDREKRWGLTITDIRERPIEEVAIIVGDLIKSGAEPPHESVQALISRWIEDQNSRYYHEENATALPTPYPDSDDTARSNLTPSRARYNNDETEDVIRTGEYDVFPHGISPMNDVEVAGQVVFPVVNRLSAEKKVRLLAGLFSLWVKQEFHLMILMCFMR